LGRIAAAGIVAFWAGMMGLLVQREIVPAIRQGGDVGYRAVLALPRVAQTDRFQVIIGGENVGTSETRRIPLDDGGCRIANRTEITSPALTLFGRDSAAVLTGEALIGREGTLRRLNAQVTTSGITITVAGVPEGDELAMTIGYRNRSVLERIPFDSRTIAADIFSPFSAMPALHPGLRWPIQLMNPITQKFEVAWAEVTGSQTMTWNERPVEAYCVLLSHRSFGDMKAWVAPGGVILKESGPFGIVLLREGVRP
jgi:hypothetical protein